MSTSRAIKPKRDDTQLKEWESIPERAPSLEVDDRPLFARIVAMVGLFLFVLGVLAMLAPAIWSTRSAAISPAWGFFLGSLGVVMLTFHNFVERDFQFRRIYAFVGIGLVLLGVILRIVAFKTGILVTKPIPLTGPELFYYFGVPGLGLGLVLLVGVIRNETDIFFRNILVKFTGALAALMIGATILVCCYVGDVVASNFLAGEGALLVVFGVLFALTYIAQELDLNHAHYASLGLGGAGLVGVVLGLVRSFWPESVFFVPGGIILIGASLGLLLIGLAILVDWPIIVLARRELAAYFYSPVAYLVILGLVVIGWLMFWFFVDSIMRRETPEPIVGEYIFGLIPVIMQIFLIPAITMRLLSEETRSGTLEVLLTAPVTEISVVLGKFFACWMFYMLCWLPWWLYLVALRFMGGEEFDYRPVLSFMVAQGAVGAGLLAMGLFFSSLTGNQIIAAVLTFVGVMAHLAFYFMKFLLRGRIEEGGVVHEALTFVNFFDLWQAALAGTIAPRHLIFHVSVAAFFVFTSVKILESRKWK